jgi:putative MATE family efflux protein
VIFIKENYMTEGPITKAILTFAFPILIGNVFQQLYNVADTAIIGHILGDHSLAAVGASAPIVSLIIGFVYGITNGFSVIIARYYGAKDYDNMRKAVAVSYVLTLIIATIMTVASRLLLGTILRALSTPSEIINETESYLKIIITFCVITCFYNMFSGLMRAIGNSRMPLVFLIISSIINVMLDYIFVKYFGWGVKGAATATVIAQAVSVILCMLYVYTKSKELAFTKEGLNTDMSMVKELISMGLSMGLMLVVVSIGSVALQRAVNYLGSDIITAHTAARKVDDLFMLVMGTISVSASTFASQNLGAGHYDRIREGIKKCILISWVWSLFAIAVVYIFGTKLIYLISGTSNEFVIATSNRYIRINIAFFMVLGVLLVLRSSLQGLGRKMVPVAGSIVEMAFKFGAVGIISRKLGYFGVCILEPIIWVVCAILVLVDFMRFLMNTKELQKQ